MAVLCSLVSLWEAKKGGGSWFLGRPAKKPRTRGVCYGEEVQEQGEGAPGIRVQDQWQAGDSGGGPCAAGSPDRRHGSGHCASVLFTYRLETSVISAPHPPLSLYSLPLSLTMYPLCWCMCMGFDRGIEQRKVRIVWLNFDFGPSICSWTEYQWGIGTLLLAEHLLNEIHLRITRRWS